ncbi:hypothetical protein ACPEH1_20225 [Stenotrophomonas sp. NPDC077421]|uniref:hypothetical protein n=1 Tax=Stenotrophomonas sp. NPDC077421 TaxID=3414699 RepID=UPI003C2F5A82
MGEVTLLLHPTSPTTSAVVRGKYLGRLVALRLQGEIVTITSEFRYCLDLQECCAAGEPDQLIDLLKRTLEVREGGKVIEQRGLTLVPQIEQQIRA